MTQKMSMRSLALAAVLAVATGATALAQNTTQGGLAGTVFDPTGAAVPNATIRIHDEGTNADLTITAGASGEFKAPLLNPGTYTVTIAAPGFQEQRTTGVVVQVQQVTELNPHLTTGSESSTVDVTADLPAINFESPEFGGHLSNREIENIPINNRRWSTLALTTPGVTIDSNGFGLLQFRAIAPTLNNVQIDGADDNQAFFSEERGRTRAGYSTSQAMVREFQVNTGVYSAEFGRAVGGVVNSVTKTGTNQLHGEAYFYRRDDELGAFNPYTTLSVPNSNGVGVRVIPFKPKDKRNQYGFEVGGPLIKDRLFFTYAFDVFDRQFPGVAKANNAVQFFDNADAALPTGATCNLTTGAATGLPSGTGLNGQGVTTTYQSSTDAAACLLAARLNSRAAGNTYATAAAAYNAQLAALNTDLGTVPRYGHQNINTPKLNWQITPKHNLSVLYHRLRWDSPGGVQTQSSLTDAVDYFGTDFVKLDYGLAKLDSVITNNMANELRYQYGRELNDEGQQPLSSYSKQFLQNPATGNVGQYSIFSSLGFALGSPYYSYRKAYPDERKWQVGDTLSINIGKHNIRVGEDIVHNYDLQNAPNQINGAFTYSTSIINYVSDVLAPGHAGTCNTGLTGVGNLPCYNSYLQSFGPYTFDFSTMDYGFFVQDDWKIAPRLTLNLGARYDFESIPKPFAALNNTTLAPQTAGHPDDKNNISPRIGFAWDPYGQGKTVVRGGMGFYYGRIANSVLLSALTQTGSANGAYNISYSNQTSAAPLFQGQVASASPTAGGNIVYLDNHFQNPVTYQADLTVQQDLGRRNVLSLAYLGSAGRELPNFINVNQNPNAFYTETYTVQPSANGGCNLLACGSQIQTRVYAGRQYAATGNAPALNSIGLNPTYGSVTQVSSNINSSYHALSFDITNRSLHWATFDANYTWAHALDFSQGSFTGTSINNWLDPFGNQRLNYGTSSYDVHQRVVGWAIFNIPGIENDKSALAYLTNGWSIKPLIQAQTGLPYSATVSGTTPNQCTNNTATNAASRFCDGTLAPTTATNSGLLGTSITYIPQIGRNTFRYPRLVNVDVRLQKDFRIKEGKAFSLYIESFNLANHQNVTGVNGGAFTISSPAASAGAANGTANLVSTTNFGTVSNTNSNYAFSPRQFQIAGRFTF
ncbi:outer membrane beta-barrel protein [Terriglobus aquaticus]|uniref:Carboxypeptidase regulatory-like domain-containing protein n=1 Tax=Terriglobus aquaticus TaxID=940139 RepID=A0ABW9KR51_9BACT|nr:carboxypeptidase regulatory-like domain-containing protein [Terriglobus aquaticus]